jgi:hypothetical protein
VIAGSSNVQHFDVFATLSSDGCGVTNLPSRGDKWIIYARIIEGEGKQSAYPLALVKRYDRRLANVR